MELLSIWTGAGAVIGAVAAKLLLWWLFGKGEPWRAEEWKSAVAGAVAGIVHGELAWHALPPETSALVLFYNGLVAGAGWAYLASIKQSSDRRKAKGQ